MFTRRHLIVQAALIGGAYTTGYLTPVGHAAASFVEKCVNPIPTVPPSPPKQPASGLYDVAGTKVVPQAIYFNATSIFGLARNHSPFARSLTIHAHVYHKGDLINTSDGDAFLNVVPAHGVSPFRIDALNQTWAPEDKVLFSVEATDNGYTTPQITGVNVRYVPTSDGSAHVSGYIKNMGHSKVTFPEVGVAYFDRHGTVLYFNSASAETTNSNYAVGPGEQVLFFLKVDTVPAGAASHQVYLDARQETA